MNYDRRAARVPVVVRFPYGRDVTGRDLAKAGIHVPFPSGHVNRQQVPQ